MRQKQNKTNKQTNKGKNKETNKKLYTGKNLSESIDSLMLKCVTSRTNDSLSLDVVLEVTHFCVNESIDSLMISCQVVLYILRRGRAAPLSKNAVSAFQFSCERLSFTLEDF